MFVECSLDGTVELLPLRVCKPSSEILGLPAPLVLVSENAIAFNTRVGISSGYEFSSFWGFQAR